MDYIRQLNAFYAQMEHNPVSANASALYNALMHICNKTRWLEYFTVANKALELKSGLENKSLQRARRELVNKSLLIYEKGGGRYEHASYSLPVLYDPVSDPVKAVPSHNDLVSDLVSDPVSDPVSDHSNKHKQYVNKNKNKKNNMSGGAPPDAARPLKNVQGTRLAESEKPDDAIAVTDTKNAACDIIAHLNAVLGTNFTSGNKQTREHINARLNEGFTLGDFIAVIDKKAFEWANNPKMAPYLRPQTLFGTKFESYLNQPWTDGREANPTDIALRNWAAFDAPADEYPIFLSDTGT